MKYLITLIITSISVILLSGQSSYTVEDKHEKISIIEIDRLTLIGTDEEKITIKVENGIKKTPEKAKGLKLIDQSGFSDNTGIGLSVVKETDALVIRSLGNNKRLRYLVYVPHGSFVQYESTKVDGKKLIVKDLKAELDVSTNYNDVEMSNIAGAVSINAIYGSITADFAEVNQENTINLYSVYDFVEVMLPKDSKAQFKLSSVYGDIYTNLELDGKKSNSQNVDENEITGTINDGNLLISLKSTYKDIYLKGK